MEINLCYLIYLYMKTIGIDQSINSTGICIWDENKNLYYNIVSKLTKKQKEFTDHPSFDLTIIEYEKYTEHEDYIKKEESKTKNIYNITKIIEGLIRKHNPDILLMEGVSYSSNGSVVDLAGLNYCIRMLAIKYDIKLIIVPPTTLKKSAIANGQATKDMMIDAWRRLENINENRIKIDDISDAYFLAHFPL